MKDEKRNMDLEEFLVLELTNKYVVRKLYHVRITKCKGITILLARGELH